MSSFFKKVVISISLLLFIQSFAVANDKVIFHLVTENLPPFNMSVNGNPYEHKEESISGINTDTILEVFRRSGYDYRVKLRNWNYAYNYAQRKAFRGVFGTTRTSARESLFKWVGPIATNDWVLFARKDSDINIQSLDDAKPYVIGCYQDDIRANFLKKNGFRTSELDDDSLNPVRLSNKLVDLWITSTSSGYYYAKLAGVKNIRPIFPIRQTQTYLALNKETPDGHVDHLNNILDGMRKDGSLDKITSRYR